jgi:hypothetical protein
MSNSLLASIAAQLAPTASRYRNKYPDYRGEYWCLCPFHDDHHANNFSFSERGYSCFAGCGAKGGLVTLARHLQLHDITPMPTVPKPERPRNQAWRSMDYAKTFLPLPQVALDAYYARGFTDTTIERWQLGYGILSATRCRKPRLVLPFFRDGKLVALRGRTLTDHTDCGGCEGLCPKYLPMSGSDIVLFGEECLQPQCNLIITEGPFDAILGMQKLSHTTVVAGTSGAGCWLDDWTQKIASIHPKRAWIVFDNEPAPQRKAPQIANDLLTAGVKTFLFHWPPNTPQHEDLADYLTRLS